ncbi:MAG: phage head-tail adaptor, partial [Acidimicrobiales bacterium]|nr:phage head-tail adaptor [Acidimicrobiales bacterium]
MSDSSVSAASVSGAFGSGASGGGLVTSPAERFAVAQAVADATLYEGYVLYPYRASAAKNRVRWQFGVLAPRAWAEADGSERWRVCTECVVDAGPAPALTVRVRFLHLQQRTVEAAGSDGFTPVASLDVGGVRWVRWDEAVERVVDLGPVRLLGGPDPAAGTTMPFAFAAGREIEELRDDAGAVVGRVVRWWDDVEGTVSLVSAPAPATGGVELTRVAVEVANAGEGVPVGAPRDDALARSLLGVHTLLVVEGGTFVSLLDPPPEAAAAVAGCTNDGTFPVLVADPAGGTDVVLSSPITLYDHPVVAPESQGDLYDSTEIDEILALRVLTLTDEEKAEARGTDPRAAAIVDRCDAMPPEIWERLHGAIRAIGPTEPTPASMPAARPVSTPGTHDAPADVVAAPNDAGAAAGADGEAVPWWDPAVDAAVDPWTDHLRIGDVDVAKGTRVVLRPSRRSDAQDLFLVGMAATVAGVFHDVDGELQVAVTVDDDPATEELSWQGRYLFFFPDE